MVAAAAGDVRLSADTLRREAAWRGVLESGERIPSDSGIARHAASLASATTTLRRDDQGGTWWRAGSLAAAEALSVEDARFDFVHALARSALFGETIIRVARTALGTTGDPTDLAAGRLVNVFVTCFDGICDETPELLPATVPYLDALVAALPGRPPPPPETGHPVIALTHDAAGSVARWLGEAQERHGGPLANLAAGTVREAYRRQLLTLGPRRSEEVAESRTMLSVATFAVTLALAAVSAGIDETGARRLVAAAEPIGALYGWIDDVVDVANDVAAGRPNLAALVTGGLEPDEASLAHITAQTQRRWLEVRALADSLCADRPESRDAFVAALRDAAWAWLGFPGVNGDPSEC